MVGQEKRRISRVLLRLAEESAALFPSRGAIAVVSSTRPRTPVAVLIL